MGRLIDVWARRRRAVRAADLSVGRSAPQRVSYTAELIYGGFDGTVTTFAVVAGVAGAGLPVTVTLILGLANLVADGFSMAAGAYLSSRAEAQRYATLRRSRERAVSLTPDEERREVLQILSGMGLSEPALSAAAEAVTADERHWIDLLMLGEHGQRQEVKKPHGAAAATFVGFGLFGLVPLLPLLPFAAAVPSPFAVASGLTGVGFVGLGLLKARHAGGSSLRSVLETLAIGAGAAGLAYVVGDLLASLT